MNCVRGCKIRDSHGDDCPGGECSGCLPRPADEGVLCSRCFTHGRDALADLPRYWAGLAKYLARRTTEQEKVSGSTSPVIPIDIDVADARLLIERTLGEWTQSLARHLAAARPPGSVRLQVAWLDVRYSTIARRDYAGRFVDEVLYAHRRAHRLLNPPDTKRVKLGPCPEVDCPGGLSVVVSREGDMLRNPVECSWVSSHVWESGRGWLSVAGLIRG